VAVMAGLLGVSAAGCAISRAVGRQAPAAASTARVAITSVGIEPKTLDVKTHGTAVIRYTLSRAAEVVVDLVDDEGRIVRRLRNGQEQPAGPHTAVWDGLADNGQAVAGGAYRYVIRTKDVRGRETVYDPSTATGGEELQPRDFTYEPQSGAVRWLMPRAGYARIRVGLEGFPHLRTLLDWEPLEAGEQQVAWDGKDASGLIQVADHPNRVIRINAFALADNTVIVRGPSAAAPDGPTLYAPSTKEAGAYFHAHHARAVCHEVRCHVMFPDARRLSPDGQPVLSGKVPVRVVVDEVDAASVVNQRFEMVLYEDLTLLFEEEEALNPFTFLWDTSSLPAGLHLLTVNLLTYDDHYGVATLPVMIEKPS